MELSPLILLYMLSAVSLDTQPLGWLIWIIEDVITALPIPQSRQLQEYSLRGHIGEPLACSPYRLLVGP